jgi:hypothetical protein
MDWYPTILDLCGIQPRPGSMAIASVGWKVAGG